MLIALFTDIHANREAFEACLADVGRRRIDRFIFLGDHVGYGADPGFVVDTVGDFVARGATALIGNHDSATLGTAERMNDEAMLAIEWTRRQLEQNQLAFLRALPLTAQDGDHLYVHASAASPAQWEYVFDQRAAARSLHATNADRTFCGHTHVPALFHLTATGHVAAFDPLDGVAMPLTWHRRWVAVIGAVGQPRDGNPAACYALFDDVARELTYVRVPYDIATAQRKIRDAGLPPFLSARLARGM
jgi:diadenosine tetraphosphatase ApaH/serine/threonine PP2A family protein phosphatase